MDELKNYEIAYLLSPSLSEEEVVSYTNKLTSLVETSKGVVKYAETPRKRKLGYSVDKNTGAYFGWVTFSVAPIAIKMIDKGIKEDKNFIRFLIIDKTGKELQFKPIQLTVPKTAEPLTAGDRPTEQKEGEEKLDLEALDKKLEEILGK